MAKRSLCRHHPRWEPYALIGPVRICAGCALQVRSTQPSEMTVVAKPSEQPRTESCVGGRRRPLRGVDREVAGRNVSKREHSPEIDRDRSSRPYPAQGKAEPQLTVTRVD